MRTVYKCMECGNDRMISTALCGTNCARCGSHNISLIDRDAAPVTENPPNIVEVIMGITTNAIKNCISYDRATNTIKVDQARINDITEKALSIMRTLGDIATIANG